MALEYNLSGGTAVTDKPIYCNKAVTVGGSSLYQGRVSGLAAASVVGTAQTMYGIWTGTAQTGSRLAVITAGVPSGSTQVLWDLQSGRVYSTTSRTVYGRYWKYADLLNEGRIYQINIPFSMSGTVEDVVVEACPWDVKWGEYQISVNGSRPASTACTFRLLKNTAGTGGGATLTLGATATRCTDGFLAMATKVEMDTADKIVIRNQTGNAGFSYLTLTLREVLE